MTRLDEWNTARRTIRALGLTVTRSDGEYRVNFVNGKEATAYYTNDLEDAVNTAHDMKRRANEKTAS